MKEQCMMCGSVVEDVSGVCPVCGAVLPRSQQVDSTGQNIPQAGGQGGTSGDQQNVTENDNGQPNVRPTYNLQQEEAGQEENNNQPNQGMNSGSGQGGYQPQNQGAYGGYGGNPQGGYYAPNQGMYNSGPQGGYQGPYNYQNPNMTPQPPKKKLFSFLALGCGIASLCTCCLSWLGIILGIVSIVFAILAFSKKQVKAPAIIGLVIGVIGLLFSIGMLSFNLLFKSMVGTDIWGLYGQMMEAQTAGPTELTDVVFMNPADGEYYALYSDGTFETSSGYTGKYSCENIVSYSDSYNYDIIFAMSEGYEIKELTVVNLGGTRNVFIIPEGFQPGDDIYYIEYSTSRPSLDNYKVITVDTTDINDYLY